MKANTLQQNEKTRRFIWCSINAHAKKKLCEAFGLKMPPTCTSVLKGVCGKVN